MSRGALLALPLLLWLNTVSAAEMRSINVEHHKGRYTVSSEVWFDATVKQVFEVFRHWDLSTQFSSAIAESRDIAAGRIRPARILCAQRRLPAVFLQIFCAAGLC